MEVEMKISEDAKPMASETTKEVNMTTSTNIVNRIPPSTSSSRKHPHSNSKHAGSRAVKRRGSFGSRQEASSSSNDGSSGRDRETSSQRRTYRASSPKRCKPMDLEEVFEQLDPNQPDEARRIFQRRKMLQKGKNTLGYQNYLTQVPKVTRQPRSMKTPATPDPTLKISAKRWQGLVKAWRIALHDYDPPDMVNAGVGSVDRLDDEASDDPKATGSGSDSSTTSPCNIARAQELEKAAAMGLVVDADALQHDGPASPMAGVVGLGCDDNDDTLLDESSPISILTEGSLRRRRESLDGNRADRGDGGNGNSFAPARVVTARRRWADEDSSDDDDDLL